MGAEAQNTEVINEDGNQNNQEILEAVDTSGDDYLLGGRPPLLTILILSIGPLVSQIVAALTNVIGSIIVASTIGQIGVEVYGAVYTVEFIPIAVAHFLNEGLSVRLSYLYGAQETEHCDQLFVDFLRLSLIFGIIVPAIIFPIMKPIIIWFGSDEKLADMSFDYMIPITAGSVFNIIFFVSCGVIQADGKSITFAIIQVVSFVLNICVFDPLFLIWMKLPIWSASLATILSQAIPGIIITILVFQGKYRIHPTWDMFLKKFSPETSHALKVGLSTLISQISLSLPFLLMQKYVNLAATAINQYDNAVATWAVVEKLYLIVGGICIGFSQGFLNPASYAYGGRNMKRFLYLTIHGLWLCTMSCAVISVAIISLVIPISKLWGTSEEFLIMSKHCTPILYYTAFTLGVQYIIPVALQAMNKILSSSIVSILTLVLPVPVFSTLLYFTGDGHKNPERIFYTYNMNDIWSFLCCWAFFIVPLKNIIYAIKHPDDNAFTKKKHEEEEDVLSDQDENMDDQEREADEL